MSFDEYFDLLDRDANPEGKKIKWTFQNLIPERSIGFLVGERGIGKSQAVMRTAVSLATGQPIAHPRSIVEALGSDFSAPPVRGSTLYFGSEGKSGVQGRIWSAEQTLSAEEKAKLPISLNGHPQLPIIPFLGPRQQLTGSDQIDLIREKIEPMQFNFEMQG